jgi:hypothetical protein
MREVKALCVGKIQSFRVLKQVVHIVTTVI